MAIKNVVSVIMRRPFNIYSSRVLWPKQFGILCIWLSMLHPQLVSIICLEIGLRMLIRMIKYKYMQAFVLYYGPFGMCVMTISLTMQNLHLLCRLFPWLPIGSVCGPTYNQWRNERIWILGATGQRGLRGICTSSAAGVLISAQHISAYASLVILFVQMVDTCIDLCDP